MRLFFKTAQNRFYRDSLSLAYNTGFLKLFSSNKPKILVYHGVAPNLEKPLNWRHIDPDCFEKHLVFLKKHAHVIPLKDFFECRFVKGKKNIAITFDDGYRNNYTYAFPLLKKYQVPATIFVTGINNTKYNILWGDLMDIAVRLSNGYLDIKGQRFYRAASPYNLSYYSASGLRLGDFLKTLNFEEKMDALLKANNVLEKLQENYLGDYWQLLNDNEIEELAKSELIEIGAHGFYHNNLGRIPVSNAQNELKMIRDYLFNLTGEFPESIAYPDGCYTRDVIDIAEKTGFKMQLAVNYRFGEDADDPRIIDRLGLYSYQTLPMQYYNMVS